MQQQQKDNSRIFSPTYELNVFAPMHLYFPQEMEKDLKHYPDKQFFKSEELILAVQRFWHLIKQLSPLHGSLHTSLILDFTRSWSLTSGFIHTSTGKI